MLNSGTTEILSCPFPAKMHPQFHIIVKSINEFLSDGRLCSEGAASRRARVSGYGTLAGMMFPNGEIQALCLFARFFCFFFEADERCIEVPARKGLTHAVAIELLHWGDIVEHAESSTSDNHGVRGILRGLTLDMRTVASPQQIALINYGFFLYCTGAACEANLLAEKKMPTVQEYLALRYATITKRWVLPWIEIIGGYELPGATRHRADVDRLTSIAANIVGWSNDIVSCRRELSTLQIGLNLPNVLAYQRGYSLNEGVAEAIRMYENEVERFREALAGVRGSADDELQRYLDDLELLVGGWLRWLMTTQRYI